jgi:hypothetical protein
MGIDVDVVRGEWQWCSCGDGSVDAAAAAAADRTEGGAGGHPEGTPVPDAVDMTDWPEPAVEMDHRLAWPDEPELVDETETRGRWWW